MIRNLGSNITPNAVQRGSKTLVIIEQACSRLREETDVAHAKDYHTIPSKQKGHFEDQRTISCRSIQI